MNYYEEIKSRLIDNEIYSKVKDYSKERNKVITYFEIGRLLNEVGSVYGENVIGKYSKKLQVEVGKKYNNRTLRRMRQFYRIFSNEKWSAMPTKLTWSHYTEMLVLEDINEINYYVNISIHQNLTYRQLHDKIKSNEYERLPVETREKLASDKESNIVDLVKNSILIKKSNNYEVITEKVLQRLILEDIPSFLDELGDGFTFIRNEYKIKVGDSWNYIDLLLFNYEYNCFVVVELKVTGLKKEHIGQVKFYMNYIDNHKKNSNQNKTIGIIICKKDNKYVIEYCSDKRIIAREYELV